MQGKKQELTTIPPFFPWAPAVFPGISFFGTCPLQDTGLELESPMASAPFSRLPLCGVTPGFERDEMRKGASTLASKFFLLSKPVI